MKPMLASKATPEEVVYNAKAPFLVSPKLDGIRAFKDVDHLLSRKLKPIPNKHVQELARVLPLGIDGELVVGNLTDHDVFRKTTSGVMSHEGEPDVCFYAFDTWIHFDRPFCDRLKKVEDDVAWLNALGYDWVKVVPHQQISSVEGLVDMEEHYLAEGFEGLMARSFDGPYKYGRSTLREGHLLKVKRFEDSEAIVLGAIELLHNENTQTRDNLGGATRSNHKAGMKAGGTLGALQVKDLTTGVVFNIGSGFDAKTRDALWQNKPVGKIVNYRFFPTGSKDKPRFPVFHGFRDPDDL